MPAPLPAGHPQADVSEDTVSYRPVLRPPTAVLQIADDGQKTAEFVRIRMRQIVIGRTEGDVVIPHDSQVSSRHAEIVRVDQEGQHRWLLRDLNSTNGTFVRVRESVLKAAVEFLIARRRFRFVDSSAAPAETRADADVSAMEVRKTSDWRVLQAALRVVDRPCLVEMLHDGDGRRYPLTHDSHWIGRAPAIPAGPGRRSDCQSGPRPGLSRPPGAWRIENANSLNGVWLRVTEVVLASQAAFLLGEQLFVVVFP